MRFMKTLFAGVLALSLSNCKYTDEKNVENLYDVAPKVVKKVDWEKKSLAIIIDTSGSMEDKLGDSKKIDVAKRCLESVLKQYKQHDDKDHNIQAGLFYFHNSGVKNAVPISTFNYAELASKNNEMEANANTPLGIALAYAERSLDEHANGRKYILLLTDGQNNTGKEPGVVYGMIKKSNESSGDYPTNLFVVAFDTSKEKFESLEKQGAEVYEAKDEKGLLKVLNQHTSIVLEKPIE